MTATEWLESLRERAGKPGLIGLAGMACEARCTRDLAGYFRKVRDDVEALHLEELATSSSSPELAGHTAEMRVHNILRNNRSLLLEILSVNLMRAALTADKTQDSFAEATRNITVTINAAPLDKLGLTAREAADYAAQYAAQLVTGVDRTTQKQIADAISSAIRDQVGVPGAKRIIRLTLDDMTTRRAQTIARTEMNSAWSWSALQKMHRDGVEYKRLLVHPDEKLCATCQSIADAGPVPIDDPFVDDEGEEYESSPIHPNCRCATTGARGPEE